MTDLQERLSRLHDEDYNFNGLLEYIERLDIDMRVAILRVPAAGFASFDKIYLSEVMFRKYNKEQIFFVICHEISHWKSFQKRGLKHHLDVLSSDDLNAVVSHILHEEILADRFSCQVFYWLNGFEYDGITQELDLPENQEKYIKNITEHMFQKYPNNVEMYNAYVDSLIVR